MSKNDRTESKCISDGFDKSVEKEKIAEIANVTTRTVFNVQKAKNDDKGIA